MRRYKQVNITGNNSSNGEDLEGGDLTEGANDTASVFVRLWATQNGWERTWTSIICQVVYQNVNYQTYLSHHLQTRSWTRENRNAVPGSWSGLAWTISPEWLARRHLFPPCCEGDPCHGSRARLCLRKKSDFWKSRRPKCICNDTTTETKSQTSHEDRTSQAASRVW